MVSLAITPENLPVIAAKLGVAESTLSAVVSASQTASLPLPPAIDDVSTSMAKEFCDYQPTFYTPTTEAVSRWQQGSEVLVPVSIDYETTDTGNGAAVGCQVHRFGD